MQIFKNGQPQPTQVEGGNSYADYLLYLSSPGTLYASDTEDSGETLSVFSIDSSGLKPKKSYSGLGGGQLATDGKNIFESNGKVISPANFQQIATMPFASTFPIDSGGWVTVDKDDGKAYFSIGYVPGQYQPGIYVVSTSTFKILGAIPTLFMGGYSSITPGHLLRIGSNGMAFRSGSGIYLIKTGLVTAK